MKNKDKENYRQAKRQIKKARVAAKRLLRAKNDYSYNDIEGIFTKHNLSLDYVNQILF